MKKRDIIQLVKEVIKENTFYGNREMPSQLSTGTKVSVPTDEYPFSRKPKRTATGMMEEEYTAKDQWSEFSDEEKAGVLDVLGKDGDIILKNYSEYDEILDNIMKGDSETFDAAILDTPLNEAHPLNKVIGGRPYRYIGGPTKGQYILSGPMNDREKETIIRGAKQAGYIAKPNMGGGVTIFLKPPAVMDEAPMFRTNVKMDPLPIRPERLKKVFDAVNNSSRPEFFKNVFKGMYRIPFPENLKNITRKQALKMNIFMNDMKNKIKEDQAYNLEPTGGGAPIVKMFPSKTKADQFARDASNIKKATLVGGSYQENLKLTNDIGKDDYVDDEGRYAKSQLYKMAKYAVKLHQKLDDMEQLPAWLQSKITKASDYMSMVYHYLDYEMARRDGNLMQEMDRYKEEMLKELTEEPNEGNAFAVARLKAIKKLEDKKEKGEKINPEDKKFTAPDGEKKPLTNVSDDDIKAAKEL